MGHSITSLVENERRQQLATLRYYRRILAIKASFLLNSIFLSRGHGVRGGGDGNFGNGSSELVVVGFHGSVAVGVMLVHRIPVVRWDRTQFWVWIGGRFRSHLGSRIHPYEFPNSARVGIAIIPEVYLGHGCFSGG